MASLELNKEYLGVIEEYIDSSSQGKYLVKVPELDYSIICSSSVTTYKLNRISSIGKSYGQWLPLQVGTVVGIRFTSLHSAIIEKVLPTELDQISTKESFRDSFYLLLKTHRDSWIHFDEEKSETGDSSHFQIAWHGNTSQLYMNDNQIDLLKQPFNDDLNKDPEDDIYTGIRISDNDINLVKQNKKVVSGIYIKDRNIKLTASDSEGSSSIAMYRNYKSSVDKDKKINMVELTPNAGKSFLRISDDQFELVGNKGLNRIFLNTTKETPAFTVNVEEDQGLAGIAKPSKVASFGMFPGKISMTSNSGASVIQIDDGVIYLSPDGGETFLILTPGDISMGTNKASTSSFTLNKGAALLSCMESSLVLSNQPLGSGIYSPSSPITIESGVVVQFGKLVACTITPPAFLAPLITKMKVGLKMVISSIKTFILRTEAGKGNTIKIADGKNEGTIKLAENQQIDNMLNKTATPYSPFISNGE